MSWSTVVLPAQDLEIVLCVASYDHSADLFSVGTNNVVCRALAEDVGDQNDGVSQLAKRCRHGRSHVLVYDKEDPHAGDRHVATMPRPSIRGRPGCPWGGARGSVAGWYSRRTLQQCTALVRRR